MPTPAVCDIVNLYKHVFCVVVVVRVTLWTCCCLYYVHSTGTAASCLTWLYQNIKYDTVTEYMFFLQFCVLFGKIYKGGIFSQSTTKKIQRFSNLFISVRSSTCFRRVFRPSSGAQNCTYSFRYLSDRYCYLLLAAMHRPMNVVFFISFRCVRFPVSNVIQRVLYSKTWVSSAKLFLCIFPLFSRSLVSPTYTVFCT